MIKISGEGKMENGIGLQSTSQKVGGSIPTLSFLLQNIDACEAVQTTISRMGSIKWFHIIRGQEVCYISGVLTTVERQTCV